MFVRIKPIIRKFSERPEVACKLGEQNIKNEWEGIIKKVNVAAAGKSQVFEVKKGEIVVRVPSHLWMQELIFFKSELILEVRRAHADVKEIRFIS